MHLQHFKARMNHFEGHFVSLALRSYLRIRPVLRYGLAALVFSQSAVHVWAAPPFLDENGYYWSSMEKEEDTPVIWDRANLNFYTDGTWRWTLVDEGRVVEKIATGEFYDASRNPGINQLAEAVQRMRAANDATEATLEQTLRQTVRPVDAEAAQRFESVVARLRRGEKGDAVVKALAEFVDESQAKTLLAQRDEARKKALDDVDQLYQRLRLNLAMASAKPVQMMIVSERSLVVETSSNARPLETDDGISGYSQALGLPFRLIPVGDGNFYAVATNKPQPGSPCDSLQMLMGDAVTAINDRPIRSAADLERITTPQTIVTVAKQLDGVPQRLAVDYVNPGTVQPTQTIVPPGYQPLPPGYRYVR